MKIIDWMKVSLGEQFFKHCSTYVSLFVQSMVSGTVPYMLMTLSHDTHRDLLVDI